MKPTDVLILYSQALYSNWYYYKPTHCLFDAGEGVATHLGKKVLGIRSIFLTHGHEDHIAGISNLVNVRNLISGEVDKPLTIYYPRHDNLINSLFEYIQNKQSGLIRYPLYVKPLDIGEEIELEDTKRPTKVAAFEMQHMSGKICLGYEILQERSVIDSITGETENKYQTIFFYTGDGFHTNHSPLGRADIALYEATFLEKDDGETASRFGNGHSTVERTIEWGAKEDVKILILCHISDRYSIEEVKQAALKAREKSKFRGELYVAIRDQILPVMDVMN